MTIYFSFFLSFFTFLSESLQIECMKLNQSQCICLLLLYPLTTTLLFFLPLQFPLLHCMRVYLQICPKIVISNCHVGCWLRGFMSSFEKGKRIEFLLLLSCRYMNTHYTEFVPCFNPSPRRGGCHKVEQSGLLQYLVQRYFRMQIGWDWGSSH